MATIAGLFAGIASLLLALADFFRQEPSPPDPAAYAVEDHLTHRLIDAAYAPDPREPAGAATPARWNADRARGWLVFLARYLHDHRERDLAWWLMSGRLLPWWVGPVTGLGAGAVLVLGCVVWIGVTGSVPAAARSTAIVTCLCVGGAFALFNSLVWYASSGRPPGRPTWALRGSAGRLARGFRGGTVLAAVSVFPLIVGLAAKRALDVPGGHGTVRAVELYVEAVAISVALAVGVGSALAVHNWLDAPPLRAAQVSPLNSLSQDRRSALVGALCAGLVVAVTGPLGWCAGVVGGDLVFRVLTGWPGWPGAPDVSLLTAHKWHGTTGAFGNWRATLGAAVLLPGAFFALLVLMGRAWPRFLLARIYLAARGKLPWRLMAFLADARRRELLRQSGGTFQFRHIRLQEALAGQVDRRPGPSASGTVRRRVLLTAGAVATVTAATGVLRNWRDESRAVFTEPDGLGMTTVAFRPGSRHDIAVGSEGGRVWLWPGRTESSPFDLLGPGAFTGAGPALAFHPGGRFLAACWDDRIHQWDLLERPRLVERRRWAVQTDDYWLGGLMFRQGGSRLVGATADHLFMWRVLPAGRLDPLTDNGIAIGSAFRPDAMALLRDGSLVMLDDSTGQVWKYRSPEFTERTPVLMTHQNDTGLTGGWMTPGLTANPSDDLLAVFGPKDGELWCRAPDGRTWRRARGTFGRADKVRIHPRRPWLAAADPGGGEVHLWRFDASSFTLRRSRTLVGHSEEVLDLAFSPDGERLVTAGADGTVRLWDIG